MKKLLAIAVVVFAAQSWADLATPNVDQLTISGKEAAALAAALPGDYKELSSTEFFGTISEKVLRTPSKSTQVVCTKKVKGDTTTETCVMQKLQ